MTDNAFHEVVARLVVREPAHILDRFEAAVDEGRIGATPTIARLQDELGIENFRAQGFREVLLASEDRSPQEIVEFLRFGRECTVRARIDTPTVEVAWTHPGPVLPAIRSNGSMAREVIDSAKRSLLIVGYSVTVDADLAGLAAQTIAAMGQAASRGVVVTSILHRNPKNRDALLRGWPPGREPPGIFTWPEREDDEMASLHAKVLVADARQALVTSANLTYHGYEANVEVGVRITGDAAAQLESVFHELIRVRDFVPWTD